MNLVTWNPNDKSSTVVLSNNNLTATCSGTVGVRANYSRNSGKWYWEYKIDRVGNICVGIANPLSGTNWIGAGAYGNNARLYAHSSLKYPSSSKYGVAFDNGDVISVALDLNAGTLEFYKNGLSQGISFNDIKLLGDSIYPFVVNSSGSSDPAVIANFGASEFKYKELFESLDGFSSFDGNQVNTKILIKYNNQYYSINSEFYNTDTKMYTPLDNLTMDSGFDIFQLFNSITINTETFRPIDKFDNFSIISEKGGKVIKLKAISTTLELIVATDDISTSVASNIDYFTLTSTRSNNGLIKLALSIDEGITWKTWNTATLLFEDLNCVISKTPFLQMSDEELIDWNNARDNIYENGIDVATFNTLDFNLLSSKTIRFAYVLSRPTYVDKTETDRLDWQFDAKGNLQKMKDSECTISVYDQQVKVKSLIDNPIVKVNLMV